MAQLQKKKKGNKKGAASAEPSKDTDQSKDADATEDPTAGAAEDPAPADDTPQDETPAEPQAEPQAEPEAEAEARGQPDEAVESPVEPMPPAPTSPDPDADPQSARLDTPRAGHGRQPSLSIQSKMRSSSFRKTSVSQGSHSPSPASAVLKSPPQSLPPLTGDGESVHEVFRKQSTRIEELEKENKRLEKELEDNTTRFRKTEDELEDLREANVDGAELRDKLKEAEEKAASIESLVWNLRMVRIYTGKPLANGRINRKKRLPHYNVKIHSSNHDPTAAMPVSPLAHRSLHQLILFVN